MQAMLPEMLESYGVPHFEVTPVYNPRLVSQFPRGDLCELVGVSLIQDQSGQPPTYQMQNHGIKKSEILFFNLYLLE